MKRSSLNDLVGGWFVGDFTPTVIRTDAMEVAVKYYQRGDHEPSHHHKKAVEITVVAAGKVKMAGKVYLAGDIIRIEPSESTDFEALEDTITVVVKKPSIAGDKYLD